jgi:Replication-relaxation
MTGRALSGPTRYAARASTRGIRSKIQRVAASLTTRDQLICVDLHEHRVLTTQQLFELHFSSIQRARSRLSRLHQLSVLWRNRPRTQFGSLPWHYTLDQLGAQIVAETLGVELKAVGYREDRKRTLVDSPRLEHTRATNGFFSRLCYVARTAESAVHAVEWRGESWCARRWQAHVRPDGFGQVDFLAGVLQFVLELDLGTEDRGRLEEKMERYRVLARAVTAPDVVLFCFPSEAREASARLVLGGTAMSVATGTLERHLADPFGAIWLPLDSDRRVGLTDFVTWGRL